MSTEFNEELYQDQSIGAQLLTSGEDDAHQAGEEAVKPFGVEVPDAGEPAGDATATDTGESADGAFQPPDDPNGEIPVAEASSDMPPDDGAEGAPKKKKAVKRTGKAKVGAESEPKEEAPTQADDVTEKVAVDDGPGEKVTPPPPGEPQKRQALDPVPAKTKAAKRPVASPPDRRLSLQGLDLRELDRGLSAEQQQEWNEIYASYRSKSVLTGTIMGVDANSYDLTNKETGRVERRKMHSAIIIKHRVKVLIPETEMWLPDSERPGFVLRNMVGGEIDYVIMEIDRESETAIASRRVAMAADQHFFDSAKGGHRIGEQLHCRVLSVGPKRCLVECAGRDLTLSQRDLTYTATADLREHYHPGEKLPCILKEYVKGEKFWISVKDVTVNPFMGADRRHPVGSRRQAVIKGKYGGGVFCTLPDGTTCLCSYSPQHNDSDFNVGDGVILAIRKFDYDRELVYGRILAKW